ncbi:alpha/beta hydrolase [Paraburkholderia kururiensis]|uniref:alpha/beta hydrolase n=1 Tax=Paraburkholderia kururiensis TaxID=984307 RepID=UPI001F2C9370|nr:alpha/beta hydrolase [Paraburkholderia kururiensis]
MSMQQPGAAANGVESRPTAGLRGASWDSALIPSGMTTRVFAVATDDGAQVLGYLHARGGERAVVMVMHPRELLVSHYLVPYLVQAGFACWVQGPRTVGNDLRLEHEVALLDVAAGVRQLRELGFDKVVQLGNSGGAALFAFYNQQSQLTGERRVSRTPGGRPVKLAEATMPVVDGFVFVAPHPGQGALLMNCIDPSVVDENDPLSVDPALDPFSESNGFRPKPESSAYSAEFVARYRAAQRLRTERIDAKAKALLAQRMAARERAKTSGARVDLMAGSLNAIFEVWRTDADLRAFDLSLDRSDRRWGTVWGSDPLASNLGGVGFGRVCTPESWLSTWSALSSNASFERCGASIQQPTLMLYYTGDNTVFPSDASAIFATIAAVDKRRIDIQGNHHGHALRKDAPLPQVQAGTAVCDWLNERFA